MYSLTLFFVFAISFDTSHSFSLREFKAIQSAFALSPNAKRVIVTQSGPGFQSVEIRQSSSSEVELPKIAEEIIRPNVIMVRKRNLKGGINRMINPIEVMEEMNKRHSFMKKMFLNLLNPQEEMENKKENITLKVIDNKLIKNNTSTISRGKEEGTKKKSGIIKNCILLVISFGIMYVIFKALSSMTKKSQQKEAYSSFSLNSTEDDDEIRKMKLNKLK